MMLIASGAVEHAAMVEAGVVGAAAIVTAQEMWVTAVAAEPAAAVAAASVTMTLRLPMKPAISMATAAWRSPHASRERKATGS